MAVTTVSATPVIVSKKPFNQEQTFQVLGTASELCLEDNQYNKLCFQAESIYLESGARVRRTVLNMYNKLPYLGFEVSRDLNNLPVLAEKVKAFIIGMTFQDISHLENSRNSVLDAAAGFEEMRKNQYAAQAEKEGLIDNAVAVLRSTEEFFIAAVKTVPMEPAEAVRILKEISLLDTQFRKVPVYFSKIEELRFFRNSSPHISSFAGRAEHITLLLPALIERVIAVISTTQDHRLRADGFQALATAGKGLEALKVQNKNYQPNLPVIDTTIGIVKTSIESSAVQSEEMSRKGLEEYHARVAREQKEKQTLELENGNLKQENASLRAQLHFLSGGALEHVKRGEKLTDKEITGRIQVLLAMLIKGEQS